MPLAMQAAAPLVITLRLMLAECPPADAGQGRMAGMAAAAGAARAPVQTQAWLDEHVAAARAVLAPHAITIEVEEQSFAPDSCDALDAAGRHAFARHVPEPTAGVVVPVLVVRRVRDLDVPDYDLQGVHWRYRGKNPALVGRRWIFLTARARPPTLAHEIGHFFGLPHDPGGGNLMTPGPSSPAWQSAHKPRPFRAVLTEAQARRVRAGIGAHRR